MSADQTLLDVLNEVMTCHSSRFAEVNTEGASDGTDGALSSYVQGMIECPLCQDSLTDPRVLPCRHTFCLGCLEKWVATGQNRQGMVSCPLDRKDFALPAEGGVKDFPTFELTTKVRDPFRSFSSERSGSEAAASEKPRRPDGSPAPCHDCQRAVEVSFCAHCDAHLCVTCKRLHRDQGRVSLGQCSIRLRQALMSLDSPLAEIHDEDQPESMKAKVIAFNDSLLKTITELFQERQAQVIEEINDKFRDYEELINTRLDNRLRIHEMTDKSNSIIGDMLDNPDVYLSSADLDRIERKTSETVSAMSEQSLPTPPKVRISMPAEEAVEKIVDEISSLGNMRLVNVEHAGPAPTGSSSLKEDLEKCLQARAVKEQVTEGLLVDVGSVTTTAAKGNSLLNTANPETKPIYGAAPVDDQEKPIGALAVGKKSGDAPVQWLIFGDTDKTSDIGLKAPEGISFSAKTDQIYVADRSRHKINVYDLRGKFVKVIGKHGDGRGELTYPWGITVSSNGDLYVVERDNHRVQVFDSNGRHRRIFGKHGTVTASFTYPCGVAVSEKLEWTYVCDASNHRIQIFNNVGRCTKVVGHQGDGLGEFNMPIDVAISGRHLAVSEFRNDRVQILEPSGRYSFTIQEPILKGPWGIALHKDGAELLVCCTDGILVYELHDKSACFKRKISSPVPGRRPMWLALLPSGDILVTVSSEGCIYRAKYQ